MQRKSSVSIASGSSYIFSPPGTVARTGSFQYTGSCRSVVRTAEAPFSESVMLNTSAESPPLPRDRMQARALYPSVASSTCHYPSKVCLTRFRYQASSSATSRLRIPGSFWCPVASGRVPRGVWTFSSSSNSAAGMGFAKKYP